MSGEHDGGSIYDFAGKDYQAPEQAESTETPHANRPHGQLKYENNKQFMQKAESAPTESVPKTNALYEWGLILASRDSSNYIALKINKDFNRASIGANFKAEKARYLEAYKAELNMYGRQ